MRTAKEWRRSWTRGLFDSVRTLVSCYRSGIDVEARMVALSNYLGHVNPVSSYWYLSASPELVELVAEGLDDRPAGDER